MRLGLLGPAEGNLDALARAAEFLLNTVEVTRAIYLGSDDALDIIVHAWASSVVGHEPSVDATWTRAVDVAMSGEASAMDEFVRVERARLRLKSLESLPKGAKRSIEVVGDRFAILVHDKATLEEEDIAAANFLVYGKSDAPLIRRFGPRWFISPGKIGNGSGGSAVLDETGDEVTATLYDKAGKASDRQSLSIGQSARLRVMGEQG